MRRISDSIQVWTESIKLSADCPVLGMGALMLMSMIPGYLIKLPLGQHLAEETAIGITSAPVSQAKRVPPVL
jgi:hypothetical protein